MKEISIEQTKPLLLNILLDFHRYCEKEGLRCFLHGGTLLGAIRHKGFIPWDDDIDVAMPRADYERLFENFENSGHPEYLRLKDYRTTPGYFYPFMKLEDTRTLMRSPGKEQFEIGLHIDIFPLDGMPKHEWAANVFMRIQRLLRHVTTCASLHLGVKGRSLPKKLFLLFFKTVTLGAPPSFWNKLINRRARRYDWLDSAWTGNVVWVDYADRKARSESFRGASRVMFESHEFHAIGNPDGYLSVMYGDYMTPPPPHKRNSVHLEGARLYVEDTMEA